MEILCRKKLELEAALPLLPERQSSGKNMDETRASLFLLFMEQMMFVIMNKKRLYLQRCGGVPTAFQNLSLENAVTTDPV